MPVDLSQYPAHVQAAIKAIDLPKINLERVQRGVQWLERNAPLDWRLQMMDIYRGKVVSRVRLGRADEAPLALAFRRVSAFKGPDGRVTDAGIMGPGGLISRHDAVQCGFLQQAHRAPESVIIVEHIDALYLDDAWEAALGEYRAGPQPVRPYSDDVEKAFLLRRVVCQYAAKEPKVEFVLLDR